MDEVLSMTTLEELDRWLTGREHRVVSLRRLRDADLQEEFGRLLVVRMQVFAHEPPADLPRSPEVGALVDRSDDYLACLYAEAGRRGMARRDLREAARQRFSPAAACA